MEDGLQRTGRHLLALVGLLTLSFGCATAKPPAGLAVAKNVASAGKADEKPSPHFSVTIAQLQQRKGDLRSAEASFRKALDLDAKYLPAYAGLGRLYDTQHDYRRAEQTYQAGLKVDSKSAMLWNDLGLCHAHAGRLDSSIKAFERATSLAPQNTMYENNLATVMAMAGMPEEALVHFGHSVGAADAHYNVGYLLKQRGLGDQAVPYLKKALQLNAQHAAATALLAQLQAPDAHSGTAPATQYASQTTSPAAPTLVQQASAELPVVTPTAVPAVKPAPADAGTEPVVHAIAAFPMVPVGSSAPASSERAGAGHDQNAQQGESRGGSTLAGAAGKSEATLAPLVATGQPSPHPGQSQPPAQGAQGSTPNH